MRSEGIVPVMDVNGNNGFGSGFGNNGDWAWIIILFLIFGFNGRNGFGGFGGNQGGVTDGYVLASDFAQVDRKLDSISNGICDSTFALNNNLTTGFANVQQTLCQGFSGVNQAITTSSYENMLSNQQLSSQIANCCCDVRQQISDCCCQNLRGLDNINYNLATNTCAITNAISSGIRDVIDNQNCNYRQLHDEIVANRIEDKNAQIQAQQNEINALRLSASQERQNAYLLGELKAYPVPSYIVPNPNCCYNYSVNGYGYGNGCGCNNF